MPGVSRKYRPEQNSYRFDRGPFKDRYAGYKYTFTRIHKKNKTPVYQITFGNIFTGMGKRQRWFGALSIKSNITQVVRRKSVKRAI